MNEKLSKGRVYNPKKVLEPVRGKLYAVVGRQDAGGFAGSPKLYLLSTHKFKKELIAELCKGEIILFLGTFFDWPLLWHVIHKGIVGCLDKRTVDFYEVKSEDEAVEAPGCLPGAVEGAT